MEMKKFGRYMLSTLAISLIALGTASSVEAKGKNCSAASKKTCCKTVGSCVTSCDHLKTLGSAVKKTGLSRTLSGKGPYTVFAPSDAAFDKIPKAERQKLLSDSKQLKKVLAYHVVPKKLNKDEISNLRSAKTLEGESVMINSKDGTIFIDGAVVTKPDLKCGNGTIYVIDEVLIPARGK